MATYQDRAIAALAAVDGEPVEYLFEELKRVKAVQETLTPKRKAALQTGMTHAKRMSADDIAFEEAWEDYEIALELGELE